VPSTSRLESAVPRYCSFPNKRGNLQWLSGTNPSACLEKNSCRARPIACRTISSIQPLQKTYRPSLLLQVLPITVRAIRKTCDRFPYRSIQEELAHLLQLFPELGPNMNLLGLIERLSLSRACYGPDHVVAG
jgi:hypothetical protein